jgi:hypothetical protein
MHRIAVAILSCIALAQFVETPPLLAQNTTAVPNSFFSMHVNSLRQAFPLHGGINPGMLGQAGGLTWRYIEPVEDCGAAPSTPCYHWGDSIGWGLLGWVTVARRNGMQLIYDFGSMPGWLCSHHNSAGDCTALPSNLVWISNFATALATRFKGQIKYYETYNEVDDPYEWSDTCSHLVLLHNTIYKAIKTVDPAAIVGAPNLATQSGPTSACAQRPTPSGNPSDAAVWLQNFLETKDPNGNLPMVDTVGVHTYGDFAYPGCSTSTNPPCYACPKYGCDWRVNKLDCAAQPLLNTYNEFRTVMNRNGLASKTLLVTEGGFGNDSSRAGWCASSSLYRDTACLTPMQQVAYIGRWLVLSASTWSDGSGQLPSWFGYDGGWGTLDGTHGMNPQNAWAYAQMESWIQGAVFQQECHKSGSSTVFVCDFVDPKGGQAQIVFNDNDRTTASYTPPAWAASYQSLLATAVAISGPSITVGDIPILLRPRSSVVSQTGDRSNFPIGASAPGS